MTSIIVLAEEEPMERDVGTDRLKSEQAAKPYLTSRGGFLSEGQDRDAISSSQMNCLLELGSIRR